MRPREEIYHAGPTREPSERLVSFAREHAGESVVDLGCGYGGYARRLQEEGHRVVGVDLDTALLAEARAQGVEAIEADVQETPFPDGHFDTALLFEVLEHLPEPERALTEALRIARRNVLVTVPNVGEHDHLAAHGLAYWHLVVTDHVNFFTAEGLRALADRCGAVADVVPSEPLEPFALVRPRGPAWYGLVALRRLGLPRSVAYFRLYGVVRKRVPS